MQSGDTIVAISSAVGAAPRMIVRLSGPDAIRIADEMIEPHASPGASAACLFVGTNFEARPDRKQTVPGTVYRFDAPRSVTGEQVIELHIPGNIWIVKQLIRDLISRGARQAEPGEFTARAYFNGRMDLSEA
ncbi:hypothetical protein BH09PLA1_BH09PLA1_23320 [soil metagenome]